MFARLKDAVRRLFSGEGRRESNERAALLKMCLGDERAVARLIAGECSRNPGISDAEACRRAIRRMRRDNR